MKGSLALWYDEATQEKSADAVAEGKAPAVELHFNLWRDLDSEPQSFLDIGVRFDVDIQQISRLHFFIPTPIEERAVSDLAGIMRDRRTLHAVFNTVASVGITFDGGFEVNFDGSAGLKFFEVDCGTDVEFASMRLDDGSFGTTITLRSNFFERVRQVGAKEGFAPYIRLRIALDERAVKAFIEDVSPGDWIVLSSFVRKEIAEFRINERRNFPDELLSRETKFPVIRTIHYFLVRDLRFELVDSHTPFQKMRRLEANLWRHYLMPGFTPDAAERMLIYHWKAARTNEAPLTSFVALASFRAPRNNLFLYALAAVVIGAIGAGIHTLAVELVFPVLKRLHVEEAGAHGPSWITLLVVLVLLAVVAFALLQVRQPWFGWMRQGWVRWRQRRARRRLGRRQT